MTLKTITSRDNPVYKELKHLAGSSQARRKAGRTLLEGIHLCQAYQQQVGAPQLCLVSETSVADAEVASLLAQCAMNRTQAIVVPDALYDALSQLQNGIGLLFIVATPERGQPGQLKESAVLLDNLQDPGNLGSILRSAAAAGIRHVYCGPGTAFAWSPKVLRAGMGAHFLLDIFENVDLANLITNARVPVFATSSHVPTRIYDLDLSGPAAWLFGHEGQGVAPALQALATQQVTIPQLGAIESLNVAASAAICFFEQVRQKTRQ
jgi:TrmH family RNA methyltransferase